MKKIHVVHVMVCCVVATNWLLHPSGWFDIISINEQDWDTCQVQVGPSMFLSSWLELLSAKGMGKACWFQMKCGGVGSLSELVMLPHGLVRAIV